MFKIIFFTGSLLFLSDAQAWSLFGPDSYNDCILNKIKPNMNTEAVITVKNACRDKFLPKAKNDCSLAKSELEKLNLLSQNGSYALYNGNEFGVATVLVRFEVNNSWLFPIEKNIVPIPVIHTDCNSVSKNAAEEWKCLSKENEGFAPKNLTSVSGIPEKMTSYAILSASKNSCW
jgi:hypothetical protein